MGKKSELTRQKIIETARIMFLDKGYEGLKMQELADKASVNKGLIHHYFDTKRNLFNTIFTDAFSQLFSGLKVILDSDATAENKFEAVIDQYFDLLIANPQLPVFVLFELQSNPDVLLEVFKPTQIIGIIQKVLNEDRQFDIEKVTHIVITLASLCVFPFMARPLINRILQDDKTFEQLINERRPLVKIIIANLLKTL